MTTVERRVLDGMMLELIGHAEAITGITNEIIDTAKDVDGANGYIAVATEANLAIYEIAVALRTLTA